MNLEGYLIIISLAICKLPDLIGFTEKGIKAASLASNIHSAIKIIEKGSAFASIQSLAARGVFKALCHKSLWALIGIQMVNLNIKTDNYICAKSKDSAYRISIIDNFCGADGNEYENYKYLIEYIKTDDPSVKLAYKATFDFLKLLKNYLRLRISGIKLEIFKDKDFDNYSLEKIETIPKIKQKLNLEYIKKNIEQIYNKKNNQFEVIFKENKKVFIKKFKKYKNTIMDEFKEYSKQIKSYTKKTGKFFVDTGNTVGEKTSNVINDIVNAIKSIFKL